MAIYDQYDPAQLALNEADDFDRDMVKHRFALLEKYGNGKRIVELGCGTGSYLLPASASAERAIGLDFSSKMLRVFEERDPCRLPKIQADIQSIPLRDGSIDLAYSYATLYYVPQIERVIEEISRILQAGGHAILEVGNFWSLNTPLTKHHARYSGWAEGHHRPIGWIKRICGDAGLSIIEHTAHQLLPMMGCPRRLAWLYPLLTHHWRPLFSKHIGRRNIDQILSSAPGFRSFAFRHFVVARKD